MKDHGVGLSDVSCYMWAPPTYRIPCRVRIRSNSRRFGMRNPSRINVRNPSARSNWIRRLLKISIIRTGINFRSSPWWWKPKSHRHWYTSIVSHLRQECGVPKLANPNWWFHKILSSSFVSKSWLCIERLYMNELLVVVTSSKLLFESCGSPATCPKGLTWWVYLSILLEPRSASSSISINIKGLFSPALCCPFESVSLS